MLQVFKELSKVNKNCKLIIAGDGEEREHLEELAQILRISEDVVFLGVRNDVERIYKALDTFIMTSFSEASPIAFIEAQLSGCSCVVSKAVPSSNVFTEKVVILSLDEPISQWVKAINGEIKCEDIKCSSEDFSLDTFIEKSKQLYSKSIKQLNNSIK